MSKRHPYRTRFLGEQGRAWLRDGANGFALVIVLTVALTVLLHVQATRVFLEAVFETAKALVAM